MENALEIKFRNGVATLDKLNTLANGVDKFLAERKTDSTSIFPEDEQEIKFFMIDLLELLGDTTDRWEQIAALLYDLADKENQIPGTSNPPKNPYPEEEDDDFDLDFNAALEDL